MLRGNTMLFLNREKELESLQKFLMTNKAELINLYGERRLGKTELLMIISKGLKNDYKIFYHQFTKLPSDVELEEVQEELRKMFPENKLLQASVILNWENLFATLMAIDGLICFFDEFPYLVESNKAIPSILQKVWDHNHTTSTTKILLCGSYVSVMEGLMGKKQPLHGRFTRIIPILPFNFLEAHLFFPKAEFKRQLEMYLIFGGTASYLVYIQEDYTKPLEELLVDKVFDKYSFLSQEVPLSFRTFSLKPHIYFGALLAITKGKLTHSKITNSVKMPSSNVTRLLNTLIGLNIVTRVNPFLTNKPVQYKISDPFIRFWFKYLLRNPPYPKEYVKDSVMPTINDFLSKPGFEEFCSELLITLSGQNKFTDVFQEVHSFIDEYSSPVKEKKSLEIDIVAIGQKVLLLGECKWTNKSPTAKELKHFSNKCKIFYEIAKKKYGFPVDKFKKIEHIFFSREESRLGSLPQDLSYIRLVSLKDLEEWVNLPSNPENKIL